MRQIAHLVLVVGVEPLAHLQRRDGVSLRPLCPTRKGEVARQARLHARKPFDGKIDRLEKG